MNPESSPPSVAVIVPTHRRPESVLTTVRSIIEQTWVGDVHVIVVFDQCEPHDIPVELPPGRRLTRVVNHHRSPGLAGARNTGILMASEDFIAFCDDDDSWLPEKLEKQFARLEEHEHPAVCATGILVETETRRIPRRAPERVLRHVDFVRSRIMEVNPCTILVLRSEVIECGLVDERIPHGYGEDYDLLLRLTQRLPVVSVPDPLAVITYHSGSYYAANWQKVREGLEYLRDKHQELASDPIGSARINGQLAVAHAGLGQRREAFGLVGAALRSNPREKRALVAAAIATGVPAERVTRAVRRLGRGI